MTTTEAVRSATRRASNLFRRSIAEEMRSIPGMLISSRCTGSGSIERTSFRSRRASSGQRASRHRQTLSYCFCGGGIGDGATLTHPQSCKQVTLLHFTDLTDLTKVDNASVVLDQTVLLSDCSELHTHCECHITYIFQ